MSNPEPRALTRGWFHGWCQCGSVQLAMRDVRPLLPYLKCADCGRVYQSVLAPWYADTDTENGRQYISYRSMAWPYYTWGDRRIADLRLLRIRRQV